jgi:GxxExxY protein
MPIEIATTIQPLDQEAFHALDRRVMRVVFDVHNEFGCLLNEDLYKCELAARCLAAGMLPAEREIQIRVSHKGFAKDYFMDLLLCGGFMLEAKSADRLVAVHRAQSLNYLLMAGLRHGRLVNFRRQRVQHEFISTTLTAEERRRLAVREQEWHEPDADSRRLRIKTLEILSDWGAFLDVNLYREALVYFLGGPALVHQMVEVFSGSRCIGVQPMNLLNQSSAFAVTSKTKDVGAMRDHLERLLHHTRLGCIQWINLNHHFVEFTTLSKSGIGRIMAGQNPKSDAETKQQSTGSETELKATTSHT